MSTNRHGQSPGYMPHASRPNLTLDTKSFSVIANASAGGLESSQSAPVGTRRERGLVPIHLASDQHIAKVADMMSSPTWRGHNLGPYTRQEASSMRYIQTPFDENEDAIGYKYHKTASETVARASMTAVLAPQDIQDWQAASEHILLSRGADDIKILRILPCPKHPEKPDKTFMISAAVTQQRFLEKLQNLRIEDTNKEEQLRSDHKAVLCSLTFGDSLREAQYEQQESKQNTYGGAWKNTQEPSKKRFPVSAVRSSQNLDKKRFLIGATKNAQGTDIQIKNEAQQVLERDDAIQSIGYTQPSSAKQQVDSEEQQRFDKLINRLHPRDQEQRSRKTASFVDPAIIAFAPKKTVPDTPIEVGLRRRSDSGYSSPTVYSKISNSTDNYGKTASEAIHVNHVKGKEGSNDSGIVDSRLNPAAKEFALSRASNTAPAKTIMPSCPRVFTPTMKPLQPYAPMFGDPAQPITPQQFQTMLPDPASTQMVPAQMGALQPTQGAWFPPQFSQSPQLPFSVNSPSMDIVSMQKGGIPDVQSQWGNFTGTAIPSTAGIKPMNLTSMGLNGMNLNSMGLNPMGLNSMGLNSMSLNSMGLNSMGLNSMGLNSMGLNSMGLNPMGLTSLRGTRILPQHCGPGGLVPPPELGPSCMSSSFNPQLSCLGQCYDPTHSALTKFGPTHPGPVTQAMAPQTSKTTGAPSMLTGSAVPFIPKHVPKPKVPNTMGQQNWELMHEMRRMTEPGYAQKCKEKQKKRYMRQLETNTPS